MNIELIGNFVGLTLAHTAFIGSGQGGELMVPYIILQSGAKREVRNFEAETQQKAIELAHKAIDELPESVDAWAYAQEGVVELADGTKQDVYLIKGWSNDLAKPIELYQRVQSAPFKLIGSIQMLNFENAGFKMEQAETFMNALNTGILSHKSANENWKNWFE